jgi:hypothetical protein
MGCKQSTPVHHSRTRCATDKRQVGRTTRTRCGPPKSSHYITNLKNSSRTTGYYQSPARLYDGFYTGGHFDGGGDSYNAPSRGATNEGAPRYGGVNPKQRHQKPTCTSSSSPAYTCVDYGTSGGNFSGVIDSGGGGGGDCGGFGGGDGGC